MQIPPFLFTTDEHRYTRMKPSCRAAQNAAALKIVKATFPVGSRLDASDDRVPSTSARAEGFGDRVAVFASRENNFVEIRPTEN